jgi:hypothetical protein
VLGVDPGVNDRDHHTFTLADAVGMCCIKESEVPLGVANRIGERGRR